MDIHAIEAFIAVLIPIITGIGVQWDKFPLERKNAPIAVIVLSFCLAVLIAFFNGELKLALGTVEIVFGYTAVTTATAAFLYEYVYKLFIIRGLGWLIDKF